MERKGATGKVATAAQTGRLAALYRILPARPTGQAPEQSSEDGERGYGFPLRAHRNAKASMAYLTLMQKHLYRFRSNPGIKADPLS